MLLRGKHLSQKIVDETLAKVGILGPDSCGWHYVEGLHENDDGNIAVAWDKVTGLDHHGQKKTGFMHEVLMLDGSNQFIRTEKWKEFIKTQKELLAEVAAKRPTNSPPIRWSDEETLGPNKFPSPTIQKPK